ncbi:expressed protein [Phakopsora pachyrhizi]|uniref:Expressed protein n=1 Tax=Phakopsora pachyrhizi TaxID=170000 RepID=A0AAV0ARL1_PHAPC|nr:expressed protein [Phakopsora pachyrhizi]CAH7678452.1 expressed protein [Phakopsora pachyrhizi]
MNQPQLLRRGGASAGDPDRTIPGSASDVEYKPFPPQSTYSGPKVGGTMGGFIAVVIGSFVGLCIFAGLGWFGWRWYRDQSLVRGNLLNSSLLDRTSMFKGRDHSWQRMDDEDDFRSDLGDGDDAFELNDKMSSCEYLKQILNKYNSIS